MPSRLSSRLDRDVEQIVRKYLDEEPGASGPIASVFAIYEWIQTSNSSLKRNKKQVLQDSISRVLAVVQEELGSEDDDLVAMEGDFGSDQQTQPVNLMNRAITGSWAPPTGPSGANTPIAGANAEASKRKEQRTANGEPLKKKRKPTPKEVDRSPPTHARLEDVGGVDKVKMQLNEHLVQPLLRPDHYLDRGIPIPRGILLHGPPGCGKTVISRAFAAKLGLPFIEILGPSIVSGMSGESEKQIREHFDEARRLAPCLIFIDEIDVIAPKRDTSQSQMEKRIVAQLLISMDGLAAEANEGKPVIVLAATNRPDSLDPALRRGGRFDTEINMGVPNENMREQILRAQTRKTNVASDVDFSRLARDTPGFVGADLRDLVGKAGTWEMAKFREALEAEALEPATGMDVDDSPDLPAGSEIDQSITRLINRLKDRNRPDPPGHNAITMEAFRAVLPDIVPSSKREGFATIPDTTWADIGALQSVREELTQAVVNPIAYPARYIALGMTPPTGTLLWGPPGCGKTLLAKAVAAESKANFISVKGPELYNKYVGESERAVRQVFMRARSSVPCVIFFDELDALVPRRGDAEHAARVVNTFLTEIGGISSVSGIYVIAATNRPDMIDPAILRPGRLETLLWVGLPGPNERVEILRALLKNIPIKGQLAEVVEIARGCENFSGADLASLTRRAGQNCLKREGLKLEMQDFVDARKVVNPSVRDMEVYEAMKKEMHNRI